MKPKDPTKTQCFTEVTVPDECFRRIIRWRSKKQLAATVAYLAVASAREISGKEYKNETNKAISTSRFRVKKIQLFPNTLDSNQSQTEGVTVSPQQQRETAVNSPLKTQ